MERVINSFKSIGRHSKTHSADVVVESSSNTEYLASLRFWGSDAKYKCLGAGLRTKKVGFLSIKAYTMALYVDTNAATSDIHEKNESGSLKKDNDYATALIAGSYGKALYIVLLRDIEGAQFASALNEGLKPKMAKSSEQAVLDEFVAFFNGHKLAKGTAVVVKSNGSGTLEVVIKPAMVKDYSQETADASFVSNDLCRSLFEVYLGDTPVVPDAKKLWINAAKGL